ncbi:MAG: hypothetical protein AAGH15_08845, partial [Myxococcota bacterium]
ASPRGPIPGHEDFRYGAVDRRGGTTHDETGPIVLGVGDEGAPLDVDAFFEPVDLSGGFGRYVIVAAGYVQVPAVLGVPLRLFLVEATDEGAWALSTLGLTFPVLPI